MSGKQEKVLYTSFSSIYILQYTYFLIYLVVDAYSYEYRINKSIKCGIDRLGYVSVPIDAKYSEKYIPKYHK